MQNNNTIKRTTKQSILYNQIINDINENGYKPHDLYHTEHELIANYSYSQITVRNVLKKLITNGVLYRIQGKGTFISPKMKIKQIIFVCPYDLMSRKHYVYYDIIAGIMKYTSENYNSIIPIFTTINEFASILKDISHIHKNIDGIVFFRNIEGLIKSKKILEKNNIPYIFYGSSTHIDKIEDNNYLVYDEKDIIKTAMEYITNNKNRKVVYLDYGSKGVHLKRKDLVLEWFDSHNKDFDSTKYLFIENFTTLKNENLYKQILELVDDTDLFFCFDDRGAVKLINILVHAGVKVPDDVSVMGINNDIISRDAIVPLTTIDIKNLENIQDVLKLFIDKINILNSSHIKEKCIIDLIPRESTKNRTF